MGKVFKLPFIGRIGVALDRYGASNRIHVAGGAAYETNLTVKVIDKNGREKKVSEYFKEPWYLKFLHRNNTALDLGSGLVTNVGVLALANDWNLAAPSGAAINTIKLANWHVTGTGATAAAATDIKLQTQSTNGGQTPTAGTQSLVSAANLQKYQTIATVSYSGSEAVTEWGLICASTISATTGSPFTAGSATTGTVTATPLTASSSTVQGQEQTIFENTGNATPHWGLVTSNTTSVVTVPAWYKVSDGTAAGTTPANTNTYVIRPVMWDHKVFSAINVVSGDSIQFTYTLTVTSGG
jgi:hypothetical protein